MDRNYCIGPRGGVFYLANNGKKIYRKPDTVIKDTTGNDIFCAQCGKPWGICTHLIVIRGRR
jgi:tetrahydromethanopterin S-methyltransferase subunit E